MASLASRPFSEAEPTERARSPLSVALLAFDARDSTAALASALAAQATVHLIAPDDALDVVRPALDSRVRLEPFSSPRLRRPLGQLRMCRDLVRRIRALDPDVLHMQQGHPVFNLALGRLRGYPLVVTVHEPMELGRPRHERRRVPGWPYRYGFRRADRLIVHAEALRPAVTANAAVHRVPRAVPPPPTEARKTAEDGATILFFGRIRPYKGIEYLIRAEPLVARQVPDLKVIIAGRGELGRYRRLIADPGRFELRSSFVSPEERDELFSRASVVVLPYVHASTSGVLPIAYLHRRPVVVTSVGGLPEAVDDGRTGLVVPPRDHAALADALARLLSDRELRERLGAAGRQKVETENAAELVAQRTMEVYELARAYEPGWVAPWSIPARSSKRAPQT